MVTIPPDDAAICALKVLVEAYVREIYGIEAQATVTHVVSRNSA